ncbi:MAG: hypothetical protein CSB33_02885 [Desulfobacterales bacterium]|nr:MAG: hypothetical protein CSB33_02885 [Desulfobacterales bacterium]
MISTRLLTDLFHRHLEELSCENGLTAAETEAVRQTFLQALATPYMSDEAVFRGLISGITPPAPDTSRPDGIPSGGAEPQGGLR